MALYEQIRKTREREQLSVRELARRFRVHRRDSALFRPRNNADCSEVVIVPT